MKSDFLKKEAYLWFWEKTHYQDFLEPKEQVIEGDQFRIKSG